MKENEKIEATRDEKPKSRTPKLSAQCALPQSSVDTLVKIIKGYAISSNGGETQVTYKDVASATGLNPSVVSRNNKFLLDSNILSSPKYGYYMPSESAVRFAREAAWDEGKAKKHLRTLIQDCWFGKIALQNFALRSSLTREELKRVFGIKCGASEGDSSALNNLIDFIVYADLVNENENGSLVKGLTDDNENQFQPILDSSVITDTTKNRDENLIPPQSDNTEFGSMGISLIVHIHINNFEELTQEHGEALVKWLHAIKESNSNIVIEKNSEVK